jgi:membrane-bound serine protease (ClpP class)
VILAHRNKSVTGERPAHRDVALTDIEGEGKVRVHGEIWQASSETPISAGEPVKVLAVDGMKVRVCRL